MVKNGFLASTNKTNEPTNQRFASAETHSFLSFFLSCFRSISGDEKSTFGKEGKGREGKGRRKENKNKIFLVLEFDFVNSLVL